MTLTCVRLVAGEEIIGEVEERDEGLLIENPAAIHIIPNESMGKTQMRFGLLPWLPYSADKKFGIPWDKVITCHSPNIDLTNNYNSMFGSGIQIAQSFK